MSSENCSCYQHKQIQSNMVHTLPACAFIPVTFNLNNVSLDCCKFKNIFGEFACNKEKKHKYFCDNHQEICLKFKNTFSKLVKACATIISRPHALDTFMKVFYHMFNFIFINRKILVSFSSEIAIEFIQTEMIQKIINFRNNLLENKFSINLRIFKKSLPLQFHIDKLIEMQIKANEIIIRVQINKSRDELISNNIKIHKLSKIHLKIKTDSNELFAVICKGVDKKIMSFIV